MGRSRPADVISRVGCRHLARRTAKSADISNTATPVTTTNRSASKRRMTFTSQTKL